MTSTSARSMPLISDNNTCVKIFVKEVEVESNINCKIQKIKYLINDKKNNSKDKEIENELKDISYYDINNNSVLHLLNDEQSNDDESKILAKTLKANNLYNDLHSILKDNHIDLEMLKNDLHQNDINTLCDEFKLNIRQKMKFRKLTNNIHKTKTPDNNTKEIKKQDPDNQMIAILIGDSGAGKTSLMHKYAKDEYIDDCTSNIGADPMQIIETLQVIETLRDKSMMKMTIWDTTGEERFQSLCRTCYSKADCIIICYDLSEEASFENCEKWREEVECYGGDDVVIILVGCKSDNVENKELHQNMIEEPEWKKFNVVHCACSAKTGDNVRNVFQTAAEWTLVNRLKNQENQLLNKHLSEQSKTQCCCVIN